MLQRLVVRSILIATLLSLAACASQTGRQSPPPPGTQAHIALLETTDVHTNVLSYDYFKLSDDRDIGFERAARLILAARKEFENSLTFDAVGYDAGTIGNHEFNYGLPFLSRATGTPFNIDGVPVEKCKGPHFPLVLGNVFSKKDGKPLYAPWRILARTIHAHAPDGGARDVSLRIGVFGVTPTGIMEWDKRNLDGKVTVIGMVEAAQKYVPELRAAGADVVVALVHGGIDTSPYTAKTENGGWHLAGVPGIDAILLGHSHQIFPNPADPKSRYAHLPEVDDAHGFVRGVPAVMGNYYGKNIGLIDLALLYQDGHWQVDRSASHAEVRSVKNADGSHVDADPAIAPLVAAEHAGTIAYVKTPIGQSDFELSSYFVAAGDTSALQIVNAAERDYVEKYIAANLPQYAGVPVLAAASPFKAGFGGPRDYTDVQSGPLSIANAADLYLYPNTVTAVKIDGAGLKAWLEKSATWFSHIDPTKGEPQQLLNTKVPTYTFDVIQGGLTYQIDITRATGQRIGNLRYREQPVSDAQPFIVVTNNYRASGGGGFPGLDGGNIVISAPDTNRDVLIAYIRAARDITRARFGSERNWRFAPVRTAGPVVFTSAAGKLDLARAAGLDNVTLSRENADGTAVYTLDLSR